MGLGHVLSVTYNKAAGLCLRSGSSWAPKLIGLYDMRRRASVVVAVGASPRSQLNPKALSGRRYTHSTTLHPFAASQWDPRPDVLPRALNKPLQLRMPKGAWDSHIHILDPDKYPLAPEAAYRPSVFTTKDALSFESSIGIRNVVLVQPSIYGNDNSCVLDALRKLGPHHARGVVSFDPTKTSAAELRWWHELGVRGVRLNTQSNDRRVSRDELACALRQYADAVRFLDWVVQVYVPMTLIESLEDIIPTLNVRVCIDHLGHPCFDEPGNAVNPYQIPGFASLARLLDKGHTFVKLSAPYRVSRTHNHPDLEPIIREIIRLKGMSRVVFASDWPHTRFEGLDIKPWVQTLLNWCGDDNYLIERLFKGNAEDLWNGSKS